MRRNGSSNWATSSCGKFGERRQLLNLRSHTHVRFVGWIHLPQSFQDVAPVGALPDSILNLSLKEFLFAGLFDERALCPDVSVLLTREEQKLRKLLSQFRKVLGIQLGEFDLKVRRSDRLPSPTWDTWVSCTT